MPRKYSIYSLQLLLLCTCLLAWGLSACASLPANSSDQSSHTSSDAPTATPSATRPPAQPGATAAFALAGKNLLVNGDAESGPGTDGTNAPASVPGWQVSDGFNVIVYGSPNDLPALNTPGPANRGKNFFYGGLSTEHSSASQTVDVSSVAPVLNTGQIKYTLSGWIGGLAGQNDHVELTARFLAVNGSVLGTAQLPTVLDNDRQGETELLFKTATGLVPAGTVKIQFQMDMIRTDGADNDAYADNLSFVLGA